MVLVLELFSFLRGKYITQIILQLHLISSIELIALFVLYCIEEIVYLATTYIMYINTLSFSRFYSFEAIKYIEYTLNCTFWIWSFSIWDVYWFFSTKHWKCSAVAICLISLQMLASHTFQSCCYSNLYRESNIRRGKLICFTVWVPRVNPRVVSEVIKSCLLCFL